MLVLDVSIGLLADSSQPRLATQRLACAGSVTARIQEELVVLLIVAVVGNLELAAVVGLIIIVDVVGIEDPQTVGFVDRFAIGRLLQRVASLSHTSLWWPLLLVRAAAAAAAAVTVAFTARRQIDERRRAMHHRLASIQLAELVGGGDEAIAVQWRLKAARTSLLERLLLTLDEGQVVFIQDHLRISAQQWRRVQRKDVT